MTEEPPLSRGRSRESARVAVGPHSTLGLHVERLGWRRGLGWLVKPKREAQLERRVEPHLEASSASELSLQR